MEVAVPQLTSCTSQRLSTHNPVTSTFLYCCRRSRTAFWMWTTWSSRGHRVTGTAVVADYGNPHGVMVFD